ncbi:S-layer homology domain-containing protein, partial [Anaerotignum sp.]|uniref:S-layer homology domain-containing protein n=1 Tax=Anaerotignum sp. TaxID=2039241 RepID=UPI0027146D65
DTKLYAKVVEKEEDWTTITFKVGDHGKWADSTTTDVVLDVIKGTAWSNYSAQVPANPVQNEIGWKLADGVWDNTILGDSDVIPDNGLVYTAVWTEDMADVTFQIKGIMVEGVEQFFGVVKPDSQSIQNGKMAKDPTATAIADIQRGYKLEGWYTDEACTKAFNFGDTISGNTVLYAKIVIKDEDWATVTFKTDGNGTLNGDTKDVVTDPILIGNTIGRTIPSANANTGYEFNAWYKVTEGESGTEEVQETPTQDTEVLDNMTYLAKFSPLLNVNFIINTTKAAEGTTSPVTISGLSNGTTWASIADQVPNVQGKLREGEYSHDYKFTGWNADFPETVTSNLTFNAEFDDIYTFVVEHADLNGGSYPNESINYDKKEADDTISSQANAPKRGYELTNISVYVDENKLEATTTAELIQKLKDEYDITLTEDGTLSGKMPNNCIWIKYGYEKLAERTVQYISDGTVKNMPENISDQYKGDEIEISTQVPQRDGYDFNGWKVVDDAVEVTDGTFIMPDSDVKLKAEWTPNEEVWNFTVEHYLEGSDTPFETVPDSVLKREPNIESVVLNAPQGYKFKEYQINGDPTELPITISEDGNTLSIIYEKNDLIVKHVYGDNTVYDTTQSKANVDDDSVVVNAVNSGRYTKLRSVTVNGEVVSTSRSITLDFSQTGKNEVEFVYRKKKSDSGGTSDPGSSSDNGSDFGEEVTILDEEVPLADGLNVIDHFAYIFGYKDGTVRPTNRISREEVAAIFYRLLSDDVRANMKSTTQDFPDVSGQRWSNTSIATLSNGGVIAGYPNGEFRPGNSITRAEFAVIVSKFDNLSKTDTNQFSDIENHWAKDFINSAALKGWISGYPDGTFHPNDYITRAEAMTLINSVLNRKVSKEGLLENAKYWSDNSEDAWYYEAVMEATNSHDYTRETPTGDETWTAITPDKTWD